MRMYAGSVNDVDDKASSDLQEARHGIHGLLRGFGVDLVSVQF